MNLCAESHPPTQTQTIRQRLARKEDWQMVRGLLWESGRTFVSSGRCRNLVTSEMHGESVTWIWWDEITAKTKHHYSVKRIFNYMGLHNMQRTKILQRQPTLISAFQGNSEKKKNLSQRVARIVIKYRSFRYYNLMKPLRHLSYIHIVVMIKPVSFVQMYCQNLSFLKRIQKEATLKQ